LLKKIVNDLLKTDLSVFIVCDSISVKAFALRAAGWTKKRCWHIYFSQFTWFRTRETFPMNLIYFRLLYIAIAQIAIKLLVFFWSIVASLDLEFLIHFFLWMLYTSPIKQLHVMYFDCRADQTVAGPVFQGPALHSNNPNIFQLNVSSSQV
jgi:hypothetical protein